MLWIAHLFGQDVNMQRVDSLRSELNTTNDDSLKVTLNRTISKAFGRTQYDSAVHYALRSIHWAEEIENVKLLGSVYNNYGNLLYYEGDYFGAIVQLELSVENYLKSESPEYAVYSQNLIGLNYWRLGSFDKAIEAYTECLMLIDLYDFNHFRVAVAINMALIYSDMDETQKAKSKFEDALQLGIELDDPKAIILACNNLSIIVRHEGDYKESISLLNQGLKVAQEKEVTDQVGRIYSNLGATYIQAEVYDSARYYLNLSEKDFVENNWPANLIINYWHQGELELYENNYSEALKKTKMSLSLAQEMHRLEDIKLGYDLLYDIYKTKGDWESLGNISDSLIYWTDSLYNFNKAEAYSKEEVKHELKVAELETKLKESEISKLKLEKNWILIGGVGLCCFLLLFFVYTRNRLKSKSLKQQLNLEEKYAQRMLSSIEANKKMVSSNLHDDIGQSLILAKNALLTGGSTKYSKEFIDEALHKIRSLSREEYPYELEYIGLKSSLESLIDKVESSTGLIFSESIDDIPENVSSEYTLHLYRVLQECINNTIKYSQAISVNLKIQRSEEYLKVIYQDNGTPFDFMEKIKQENSIGAKQIKDRVRVMKGQLKVVPSISNSNIYEFWIPI